MSEIVQFDSSAFREEFRKRVLRSKRTIAEVTNEITFQILKAAWKRTPKADRSKIEALGITYRTMNKAGTKPLKRKIGLYAPTTAFKLITLKGLWKFGPKPRTFASRAAIDEVTRKKLARRNSSVGFVASGWVPAMRAIVKRVTGQSLSKGEARLFKATVGSATPATDDSWSPFAEIENATGMNGPNQEARSKDRVESYLLQAWRGGVEEVTADMADYAARQVEKILHGQS